MREERFNGFNLAMLYILRDVTCDAVTIVDQFAHKHLSHFVTQTMYCE